jgi:hypothetical protein
MLFPFIGLVHINRFQGPRRNAAQINKSRVSPRYDSSTLSNYTGRRSTNQTRIGHVGHTLDTQPPLISRQICTF